MARLIRRLMRRDEGSPAIELALAMPVLALFIVGVMEFGMILFVTILMESGLRDAARYGITGREITGMSREAAILDIIGNRTIGLVDMDSAVIETKIYPSFDKVGSGEDFVDGNGNGAYDVGETFSDSNGNGSYDDDIGSDGAGGSGDVVLYRITYSWRLLTAFAANFIGEDGQISLRASVAVRNEPWDTDDS